MHRAPDADPPESLLLEREIDMPKLTDDREEVEIVLRSVIGRTNLGELLEPLHPSEQAIELLMEAAVDEEVEVSLVNDDGKPVAVLYVDVLSDPMNAWTIKLRGWRLADGVASV